MRALLFLVLLARTRAQQPYVLFDNPHEDAASLTTISDEHGGFTLCLGSQPSAQLRNSLLMCRELSYPFCVNSSLVGSVLQVDSDTAKHFVTSLSEPTTDNVEKLAWLIDSALVMLYETFTTRSTAHLECAHEWRAWVCGRAFSRAHGGNGVPLPLCTQTCLRADRACNANLKCPASAAELCTDFYKDSGQPCSKASAASHGKVVTTPVFKSKPKKHYYNAASGARASLRTDILLLALLAYFATQLVLR